MDFHNFSLKFVVMLLLMRGSGRFLHRFAHHGVDLAAMLDFFCVITVTPWVTRCFRCVPPSKSSVLRRHRTAKMSPNDTLGLPHPSTAPIGEKGSTLSAQQRKPIDE